MRARIALFKDPAALAAAAAAPTGMAETDDSDDEGDLPQVRGIVLLVQGVEQECAVHAYGSAMQGWVSGQYGTVAVPWLA